MGIRRRRRKLTTLMSRLDQRVRSVELKPANLLTAGQVAAAVEAGEILDTPKVLVGGAAPYEWTRVLDAYYYPAKLASNTEDRVEIYLEADLDNLPKNERLAVSGIHGTNSFDVDVSSDNFTVLNLDSVDEGSVWTNRASWKHDPTQNQLSGVTITNTYSFKPESLGPATWSTRQRLQTSRAVDSFEITGTTVTLTTNAVHKFKVDDVISTNISSDQSNNDESRIAAGIDGLFYITAVTGNTIDYELAAGVDAPTGTITPSADVYVFPVARRWAQEGSIWVNNSENTTYYWDGIRWVEYTPNVSIAEDGDPPSPPTGFTVDDTPATFGNTYEPYAKVTLSWTAPTTSVSGDPITDLAGYKIRWRRGPGEDWRSKVLFEPAISSYTFDDDVRLAQGTTYYFELYAFDSGQQDSTAATANITTEIKTGDIETYPPSDPVATSRLGTITVAWDGKLKTGASSYISAPNDVAGLKIFVSISSGFTPSSSNLAKTTRVFGSDGGFDVLTDLTYGTAYYIKIKVVDTSGVESPASAQVVAQVQPLVNADIISSTLTTWPFNGQVIPAGSLADGSISASSLFGPDVVTQAAISAGAIGANEIAAGAIIAGKIGASAVTAGTIAALSISAGQIQTNAITAAKIEAGAITTVKLDAGAITAAKIEAGAITADKFSATLAMASNMIIQDANSSLGRIELRGNTDLGPKGIVAFKNSGSGVPNSAFRFYTNGNSYLDDVEVSGDLQVSGTITAGSTVISSGLVSGGVIRTSSSGKRVEMRDSTNSLRFYNSNGAVAGEIEGLTDGARFDSSLGSFVQVGGGVTIGSGSTPSVSINSAGVTLIVAPTTTFAANLRRPDPGNVIQVVSSDLRIKENVLTITDGINVISQLNPVTFNSKVDDTDKVVSGFLAQDVANIFPSNSFTVVTEVEGTVPPLEDVESLDFENNPLLSLNHIELLPYLTKAIQELVQRNSDLENRIATLEEN